MKGWRRKVLSGEVQPRRWSLQSWYEQNRRWVNLPPVGGSASIEPSQARACEARRWVLTYEVGDDPLTEGSHIAFEFPDWWTLDLGRPLLTGTVNIGLPSEVGRGYGAHVVAEASREGVDLDLAITFASRFKVVDIVVLKGRLEKGDRVKVHIGAAPGSKVRAQKFAQRAVFAMGVDVNGDGVYRRVDPHPSVDVKGAWPADLKVVAPATVTKEEEFSVKVLAVDKYGPNPATDYRGKVEIIPSKGDGIKVPRRNILFRGDPSAEEGGFVAGDDGFYYLTAVDVENALAGRSNPIAVGCSEKSLFFGDIHGQMYESIGTGTLDEYYRWGRDVEFLDFCAPANHYGGRYDFTDALWEELVEKTNSYNEPGRFVTLIGYEWSGRAGHRNVYYRGSYGPFLSRWRSPEYSTLESLWRALEGLDAMTIPHPHLGNIDWSLRNDDMQRVVEICSAWGISEDSVQDALARGHRLGFIGGTDTHFGQPGHGPHDAGEGGGLAAVYADALTREAIYDAIYDRYCYATNGVRIFLKFTVDGHRMGEEFSVSSERPYKARRIHVTAAGTNRIERVEIIRNGETVHTWEPDSLVFSDDWHDEEPIEELVISPETRREPPFLYYYCRVSQIDTGMAWSSPVWITLGG
ncbi:MAG: hypothetical protein AYL32_008160 [Candidatus Bathyarchaeota archaeon B26-2]|nr:MAG: hypothetical protein AYL32_008160 [Candidatus Bathyarchaeota archaeon B26-2]